MVSFGATLLVEYLTKIDAYFWRLLDFIMRILFRGAYLKHQF